MFTRIWNRIFYNIYSIINLYRLLLLVYLNPFIWIKHFKIIRYSCTSFTRLRQIMEDDYKSSRFDSFVIELSKMFIVWLTYILIWTILNMVSQCVPFLSEINLYLQIVSMFFISYGINNFLLFRGKQYLKYFKEFNFSAGKLEIFISFLGIVALIIGWAWSFSNLG